MITYKGNKIRANKIEITIAIDDDGIIIPQDGSIHFSNVRCLGGSDGKLELGYTQLKASEISQELLASLDVVISDIYEEASHVAKLQEIDKLSAEQLEIS
jgi:hypothetical protein